MQTPKKKLTMPESHSSSGKGGAATRARILEAATRMIAEKGVAGLRIRAIARDAGIREGSIYNHFAGRAEIIKAIFRSADASMSPFGAVLDIDTSPPEQVTGAREFIRANGLEAFLACSKEQLVSRFTADPVLFRFLRAVMGARLHDNDARAAYEDVFLTEMRLVFESAYRLASEAGRLRPGVAPVDMAGLLIAAFEHAIGTTRREDDVASFATVFGVQVDAIAALSRA